MIDPAVILERAAASYGTTVADLIGPRRFARLTKPRQAAAWALRHIGLTLCEIGELLHRDHTTIISSIERAEHRADSDEEYAQILRMLIARPHTIRATIESRITTPVRIERFYRPALTA